MQASIGFAQTNARAAGPRYPTATNSAQQCSTLDSTIIEPNRSTLDRARNTHVTNAPFANCLTFALVVKEIAALRTVKASRPVLRIISSGTALMGLSAQQKGHGYAYT